MHYYRLKFATTGPEPCWGYVKTALPQNPDALMHMLAQSGFRLSEDDMRRDFITCEHMTQGTADTLFSQDAMTVRRRCRYGDFFVEPGDAAPVILAMTGTWPGMKHFRLTVPACAVNEDCTGAAVGRVIRDAVRAVFRDKAPEGPLWDVLVKAWCLDAPLMEKYGVTLEPVDFMLDLSVYAGDRIADESVYEQTVAVTPSENDRLNNYLSNADHMGEDETFTRTAVFPDGRQVDVKCCGVQDEDEPAWTEAVLFEPNGAQVCFTEPAEDFVGPWELEADGIKYRVNVVVGDGTDDTSDGSQND